MDHQKVFISHSGLDNEIIEKFERSLKVITIKPFLAEQFVATGQNVPKKIAEHIRDSNAFRSVPHTERSRKPVGEPGNWIRICLDGN